MNTIPQAIRPAFYVFNNDLYEEMFQFDFFAGFSIQQKQKCINSFHSSIKSTHPFKILEVSRKSANPIGTQLSAFNLILNGLPLECIYQGGKCFSNGRQYIECYNMKPADAKKLIQTETILNCLSISHFKINDTIFPNYPPTLFYDYIYITALTQNDILADQILQYDCFTDIEYNHKKQIASQARSCAIFKYLYANNMLSEVLSNYDILNKVYKSIIKKTQQLSLNI